MQAYVHIWPQKLCQLLDLLWGHTIANAFLVGPKDLKISVLTNFFGSISGRI